MPAVPAAQKPFVFVTISWGLSMQAFYHSAWHECSDCWQSIQWDFDGRINIALPKRDVLFEMHDGVPRILPRQLGWPTNVLWPSFLVNVFFFAVVSAGLRQYGRLFVSAYQCRASSRLLGLSLIPVAFGCVMSVGVSWALAAWVMPKAGFQTKYGGNYWHHSADRLGFPHVVWTLERRVVPWGIHCDSFWADTNSDVRTEPVADLPPTYFLPAGHDWLVPPLVPALRDHLHRRRLDFAGWPFPGMFHMHESTFAHVSPRQVASAHYRKAIPLRDVPLPNGSVRPRALPLGIEWPPFLLNVVFYALGCALVIGFVNSLYCLRRVQRIRRGRCPQCSYILKTATSCPECGRKAGL